MLPQISLAAIVHVFGSHFSLMADQANLSYFEFTCFWLDHILLIEFQFNSTVIHNVVMMMYIMLCIFFHSIICYFILFKIKSGTYPFNDCWMIQFSNALAALNSATLHENWIMSPLLTTWGSVPHICVSKLGHHWPHRGLSPVRC